MIFLDLFYRSEIISLRSLKNLDRFSKFLTEIDSKIKEKLNFKLIILLLMLIMLLKAHSVNKIYPFYFLSLFHSIYSKLILKILNYVYMNYLDIVHMMFRWIF